MIHFILCQFYVCAFLFLLFLSRLLSFPFFLISNNLDESRDTKACLTYETTTSKEPESPGKQISINKNKKIRKYWGCGSGPNFGKSLHSYLVFPKSWIRYWSEIQGEKCPENWVTFSKYIYITYDIVNDISIVFINFFKSNI